MRDESLRSKFIIDMCYMLQHIRLVGAMDS